MDDRSVKEKVPLVSVVMPLYNKEAEVRRSVESVLTQTVSDFELIVVNDGSTDRGPDVVRSISDARIRVFDQENAGVSAARNRGIDESRSGLIAYLDADDEWKPEFLETILHLKEEFPSCSVFATNYILRDVNGKHHLPIIRGLPPHPWGGVIEDYFGVAVRSDPPLCSSAVSVKKEALCAVGLFPVGVTSGEDLLTWARLAAKYSVAYTTKPLAVFRHWASTTGIPTRIPAKEDFVGKSLEALLADSPMANKRSLREYIGLWHRMRASMFFRLGNRQTAISEVTKMRCFANRDLRLYTYIAMAYLPELISNRIILCLNYLKALRR